MHCVCDICFLLVFAGLSALVTLHSDQHHSVSMYMCDMEPQIQFLNWAENKHTQKKPWTGHAHNCSRYAPIRDKLQAVQATCFPTCVNIKLDYGSLALIAG